MAVRSRSSLSLCVLWVAGLGVAGSGCSGDPGPIGGRRGGTSVPNLASVMGNAGAAMVGTAGMMGDDFGNTDMPLPDEQIPVAGSGEDQEAPDEKPDCGGVEIEPMVVTNVVPGNVLLIFDQSLSMNESWSFGQSKWDVATQAVMSALTPLQDEINAGALFFPNSGIDGCGVEPIQSGSQIDFTSGTQFTSAWGAYLGQHGPFGFTPTGAAMSVAQSALRGLTLTGTTAVVVITDGDPNCGTEDDEVNAIAAEWLAQGIKTHVFGIPGANDGAERLNALAVAGGTGQFVTPDDPAALQAALAGIATESVTTSLDSCKIALPEVPPNPEDVTLVVLQQGMKQSVARDLGTGGGWTLDIPSLQIELQGPLCEQAKQGTYEKLSVVFGCVDLPPLPPPAPPL